MKKISVFALLALAALPGIAAAQDTSRLWSELDQNRPLLVLGDQERRGREVQIIEEPYTPRVRTSLALYGRVSFPSATDVTIDGIWYSDLWDPGLGLSAEVDVLSYVAPHWAVGGYLSIGWDRFTGQTVNFGGSDFIRPDDMDLTTGIIGAKVVQRVSPFMTWEGHMGIGLVHYASVNWSGFDTFGNPPGPFSGEQLFKPINRGVFEFAGRVGFGNPHIEGNLGFGFRIMGGAARGKDVSAAIDPDVLTTFILEIGLTLRF